MRAADTSVLVAAFASWHDRHHAAAAAMGDTVLIGHCVLECYSVLTRLPAPHRASAAIAAAYVARLGVGRVLVPTPEVVAALPTRLAEAGISGGATYDALVAATALAAGAELLTLDERAYRTYRAIGAPFRTLG